MKILKKNMVLSVYEEYKLYAKNNLKPQSYDSMRNKFDLHILPFFKDMYIEDINCKDIIKWKEETIKKDYSNNFNKNLYYVLSGFLDFCQSNYEFNKSIISDVGCFKKKYEKDNHDIYTLKEFKRFIKHVKDPIYKQFFCLMFYTGTRPGEAMALKFSDIRNKYLNIDKTINSHKKREIGTPKTNSSVRQIIIPTKLKKDLLKLKSLYIEKYGKEEDYFIFGGIKPLSPSTINRKKEKACEEANIRPITLHQFRHSHASLLLNKKLNPPEISKRLGHSKVSTTLDIYTHTDSTQEKRIYDTLNSLQFNIFDSICTLIENIKDLLKH